LTKIVQAGLMQDEYDAREACGGTVVGERGNWRQAPAGDEWEAYESPDGDEELLVALRPGLPRPPDVMGGCWGAVVSAPADEREPGVRSPMPAFRHMARHDPARILAEVASKRALLAEVIGWTHNAVTVDRKRYCCASEAGDPCDCGRDARVTAVLRHLAQPYTEAS
jgi:hypothetical protein